MYVHCSRVIHRETLRASQETYNRDEQYELILETCGGGQAKLIRRTKQFYNTRNLFEGLYNSTIEVAHFRYLFFRMTGFLNPKSS